MISIIRPKIALHLILAVCAALIFSGCAKKQPEEKKPVPGPAILERLQIKDHISRQPEDAQRVLIVWDEIGDKEKLFLINVARTLDYAKIGFDVIRLEDLDALETTDLKHYTCLAFYADDLAKAVNEKTASAIKEYVLSGGGIFAGKRCKAGALSGLFGIAADRGYLMKYPLGLKIVSPFFPGSDALYYPPDSIAHAARDIGLEKDVRVLAVATEASSAYPNGAPVVWVADYGQGRAVYWNSDCLKLSSLRGLLLHSLLAAQPVSVFSLANVESIHIDDCPLPMYNIVRGAIKTHYNMTEPEFYLKIWWKDILNLSKKYNIRYTCYAVFNYDDKRTPPFNGREFEIGKDDAFGELGRRVVESGFELGLHGYNHRMVKMQRWFSAGWVSKRHMLKAFQSARDLWLRSFPGQPLPLSYAAPMNVIDRAGKEALREAFPEVRTVSQALMENGMPVEDWSAGQEFGPDPDVPGLFDMPRVTAGYFFTDSVRNSLINSINTFGVWTHFIHPNDIAWWPPEDAARYETKDGGLWNAMITSADAMFGFVRATYPWLRDMPARDARKALEEYLSYGVVVKMSGNVVTVNARGAEGEVKHFGISVNNGKSVAGNEGCKLIYSYPALNIHIFEMEAGPAVITLQ